MAGIRFGETLEKVRAGAKPESHLQLQIQRLWRNAAGEVGPRIREISTEELLSNLDELEEGEPLVQALDGLIKWERNKDYHGGAVPALEALEEVVKQAVEEDWFNVGQYSALLAAQTGAAIPDEEKTDEWLKTCDELFANHWNELTPNTRGNVIDSIPEIHYVADDAVVDNLLDTFRSVAESAAGNENYEFERRLLWSVHQVLNDRGADLEKTERHIVESYTAEAELKSGSPHHLAAVLQEALNRCAEFVDSEQLNEWKREVREANKRAIEQMPRITHELEGEDLKEVEKGVDEDVERIRELAREESGISALMTVLANPAFLPQIEEIESREPGSPLLEMISRRHLKKEGDSIPDPDEETRPREYEFDVQFRDNLLSAIFGLIIREGIISEADFYIYLDSVDSISSDDQAYLTDFIIAVFEKRYSEALHIGAIRLEGIIASQLKNAGIEPASLVDGYTRPTPLPGLLNQLEGRVDSNLIHYLRFRYGDLTGEGLRNTVAHGRAKYGTANPRICLILLYDLFRTIAWLDDQLK